MVYTISYDLNKPGKDYSALYEAIKSYGYWSHPLDSTWFISTTQTSEQVFNTLKSVMDPTDELLVTAAKAPATWDIHDADASNWLKQSLS